MNAELKAMNSRVNPVEERISDLEDRLMKGIQFKEHTESQPCPPQNRKNPRKAVRGKATPNTAT